MRTRTTKPISRRASAFAFTLVLASLPTVALAQGTIIPEATAAESQPTPAATTTAQPAATSSPQPASAVTTSTSTPTNAEVATTTEAPAPGPAAPPVPAVEQHGQWVYTDSYGWIWVPDGSSAVIVQEQPYVYLYTPAYGWTWYGSPWGRGAYYVGPWVHAGYGPLRVWHRGGWYAPRAVVVRTRVVAPAYHGGGGHGHRGGHR